MVHSPRALPLLVLAGLLTVFSNIGRGQQLDVRGILVAGGPASLTESWSAMNFIVVNPTSTGRDVRVVLYFPDQPDVQYGRDVWVPAGTSLTSQLPLGPTPKASYPKNCELHAVLIDRTGGQRTTVLPATEEKTRSVLLGHRPRSPSTTLVMDSPPISEEPISNPVTDQIYTFVHSIRASVAMPENLPILAMGPLPLQPEAFEGTDHFVIASDRLASDPAGCRALRRWVHQGGRVWFMLDHVSPETVAPFLGDDLPFEVIDRVGLTTVRLQRAGIDEKVADRDFEQPVDLVRVVPTESDRIIATANGWPAAFVRTVGRGRILFTTLGASAWTRPRDQRDGRSRYLNRPALPVTLPAGDALADELQSRNDWGSSNSFTDADLQPLLVEEIGYSIMSQRTVTAIMVGFILTVILLAAGLRRSRRPELAGWLAPVAALATGALLVILATNARRAVPSTVASAGIAEVAKGNDETAIHGLFAVYQPSSGEVPLAATQGGQIDLGQEGLEGQLRQRIQTDVDVWHWESLALPAGVRTGSFKLNASAGPITAIARFGPNGIEGKLSAAAFRDLDDALITTSARMPMAPRLKPDGSFVAGIDEALPADQFIAGSVLSDRQQRRQAVYRKLLSGPLPRHMEGRDFVLAWAEMPAGSFTAQPGARSIGTMLLVVPLEYERPPAGTRVVIPQSFVPVRRIQNGTALQPTMELHRPVQMHLRFQLPASVRPLTVEKAILHLKIQAPLRRIAIAGMANGQQTPLESIDSPTEPIRVTISDQRLLQVDDQGGLHVHLSITNIGSDDVARPWRIESLGLEVIGQTSAGE